jgi:hypothetical protein
MSEQINADLRRENEELTAKAEALRVQLELFNTIQRCNELHGLVRNDYPWAKEYDEFSKRVMVCGHHPLEPPHYHSPPPHCNMFTAFFLQSGLLKDHGNSMAQLKWFLGVLAPRPADSSLPLADTKGKGKTADTKGKGKATRKPNLEQNPAPTKKSKGPVARPSGSSKKPLTHGEGPSHTSRADPPHRAPSHHSHPLSSAGASHHNSGPLSTATSNTTPSCDAPAAPIDHSTHTVEYITGHAYFQEFMNRGAHTGLGFLLKWVGHTLNRNEPHYDIHAVLHMDPSYLTSYALWRRTGKTLFARIFLKNRTSERKRLLNKYFRSVYEEHVAAAANPQEGRTLEMELLSFANAISPVGQEPEEITDIPWPEAPYSPPGT